MLRSHFTFLMPESSRPAHLTLEFTNYCNLKCPYCTNPLGIRTQGFMTQETFDLLVEQIREFGLKRVRVVGNGESSLHPKFCEMIRQLGRACTYLTMVTNGQRLRDNTMRAILQAPVRLLEISADSDEKDGYEHMRIGGKFERLLSNLSRLRELKQELGAPTLVNIRAMIRPSQLPQQAEILKFWSAYANTVTPQYLHDYTQGAFADVFPHRQHEGLIPRCSLPSKALIVHYNGTVPLCEFSQRQTGMPDGLIVGDIHETTLKEIWNSSLFRQYREGHRKRDGAMLTGAVRNSCCRIIGLLRQEAEHTQQANNSPVSVCNKYCARRTGPWSISKSERDRESCHRSLLSSAKTLQMRVLVHPLTQE